MSHFHVSFVHCGGTQPQSDGVRVQCCFTSTQRPYGLLTGRPGQPPNRLCSSLVLLSFKEIVRTVRDGEPRTATSTFTQLLSSVHERQPLMRKEQRSGIEPTSVCSPAHYRQAKADEEEEELSLSGARGRKVVRLSCSLCTGAHSDGRSN